MSAAAEGLRDTDATTVAMAADPWPSRRHRRHAAAGSPRDVVNMFGDRLGQQLAVDADTLLRLDDSLSTVLGVLASAAAASESGHIDDPGLAASCLAVAALLAEVAGGKVVPLNAAPEGTA